MRKVVKVRSTDVLKANNDNFDKFMKKMIKENLEMANPGSYEGIFFKSNEDYVKFMKGKYTAKVDTLNIDQLWEKLGATYPRFKRDTNSRLIKSLRVTSDEYKLFEQYLFTNNFREIQNQEICLFEFVVESRLRDILKKIPLGLRKNWEENDKHSNITWKQLNHLKQSVAYFLQTHSHRAINDPNYDINDFQETDPRSKYNPHESKFFREPKQNNYSLVKKLKDIINILRNILPDSQSKFELAALYEGYYATMKHKVPPNSKESLRPPKSCHSSNATP